MLDFNGVTRLLLNIGSNNAPVLPPRHDNTTAALIFEPIIGCSLNMDTPRVSIMVAAVSDEASLATMNVYNTNGLSSSLSVAAKADSWNSNRAQRAVPVIAMRTVLQSIPADIELWFLKTDMQGYDWRALGSVGDELRRVHYLTTEVYVGGHHTYSGVKNDYCRQWLPHMLRIGFVPLGLFRDLPRPKMELYQISRNESLGSPRARHEQAALDFCARMRREAGGTETATLYEAINAYWLLRGTKMPPPPIRVADEDWKKPIFGRVSPGDFPM